MLLQRPFAGNFEKNFFRKIVILRSFAFGKMYSKKCRTIKNHRKFDNFEIIKIPVPLQVTPFFHFLNLLKIRYSIRIW